MEDREHPGPGIWARVPVYTNSWVTSMCLPVSVHFLAYETGIKTHPAWPIFPAS